MSDDLFSPPTRAERPTLSVTELNREARRLLEGAFRLIWVEGEISSLSRPASGHLYFNLKDSQAQVRCAMFRNRNQLLRLRPKEGLQVRVRARVSLYEGRGDFQLIIEHMEEAGAGAQQQALEELKQRLAGEGLFDADRKQPLPRFPRQLGIITSPSGAAIRDVLQVLKRRFPALPVVVYPTQVQGQNAAADIAAALAKASHRGECDLFLVTRGGGSAEDLWPFNNELVARAISACRVPVVSAVGHEVDFTIADMVADLRAPTPSAAAELIAPDTQAWKARLLELDRRLLAHFRRQIQMGESQLGHLRQRLRAQHPEQRLQDQAQRLDGCERRLHQTLRQHLQQFTTRLHKAHDGLRGHSPAQRIQHARQRLLHLDHSLSQAMRLDIQGQRSRLALAARSLNSLSPLATLERGYAISFDRDGRALTDAGKVSVGDQIETRLAHGRLRSTIIEKLEP